jgi:hypothetical protein
LKPPRLWGVPSIFSWEQEGRQRGVRKRGDGPTTVGGGTVQPAGPREHGPSLRAGGSRRQNM